MSDVTPSIGLVVHERVDEAALTDVLLGIEEEGVPVELRRSAELNPLVLAHGAATSSRLGIGVGIALDYVVITTDKLPENRPYIAALLNQSATTDRTIGSNAARMVKRLPLRMVRPERSH